MELKKFGLIGHPVGHSLSAVMHGRVFEELNLPYTYEAFDVLPEDLEKFVEGAELDGVNVTIPHKVAVMGLLDDLDKSARDIKAVNTIRFGERVGYNTDGVGFLNSLEEEGVDVDGKSVLVLGAGGASRAILVSLVNGGADVTLTNRTRKKAEDLVMEFGFDGVKIVDYDFDNLGRVLGGVDVIVNTTSIGMYPNVGATPVPKEFLRREHVIFDVVYNPLKTRLIVDGEAVGCKTISGVNMLVHQGAESLRIWLGIEPPIESMKNAVLEKLK